VGLLGVPLIAQDAAEPAKLTRKQERRRLEKLRKELRGPFKRWLDEDVRYIITPEERKAAMKPVRFLTQPERTAQWSIETGYIGTRPDAYETAALKQYVVDFPPAAVARDQLEFATAELSTYQTGRVRKLLDDAIQAVLTDQKSVEDALGSAQKQADRLLKRYR